MLFLLLGRVVLLVHLGSSVHRHRLHEGIRHLLTLLLLDTLARLHLLLRLWLAFRYVKAELEGRPSALGALIVEVEEVVEVHIGVVVGYRFLGL